MLPSLYSRMFTQRTEIEDRLCRGEISCNAMGITYDFIASLSFEDFIIRSSCINSNST